MHGVAEKLGAVRLDGGDVPHVVNSIGMQKVPLLNANGRKALTWYICGPTVYDVSHIGHARNYVSFDLIRRILEDYFNYDIVYQMNITDIDDKIIKRSIENQEPFETLARRMERSFMKDLENLNCRMPTLVTRVTEYIPEICSYIQKIISHGFAYSVDSGSVYFDTQAFKSAGYTYAKLEPYSVGNIALLQEGEGVLADGSNASVTSEKRNPADFALWKASKPNEPYWECPWSSHPGRPGWHIECSAMAEELGSCPIDLHSGGVDLKFPHHDNEIAQAEAFHKCHEWVRIWLHSGHLHIEGLKMSKSLKNFITIDACLERYSAAQLRIFFLQHKYDAPMNYSEDIMTEAVINHRKLVDFLGTMKSILRATKKRESGAHSGGPVRLHPSPVDLEMLNELKRTKQSVRNALYDNFKTPDALAAILDLVNKTNTYVGRAEQEKMAVNHPIVEAVLDYVVFMMNVFGVSAAASDSNGSGAGSNALVQDVSDVFAAFRADLRNKAIAVKKSGSTHDIQDAAGLADFVMQCCDNVRDEALPPLGIRLEDRANGESVVKVEDAKALLQEIERKKQQEEERQRAKALRKEQELEKEKKEKDLAQIPPTEYFRTGERAALYSKWDDETGVPVADAQGAEITKSQRKNLEKELKKHAQLRKKNALSGSNTLPCEIILPMQMDPIHAPPLTCPQNPITCASHMDRISLYSHPHRWTDSTESLSSNYDRAVPFHVAVKVSGRVSVVSSTSYRSTDIARSHLVSQNRRLDRNDAPQHAVTIRDTPVSCFCLFGKKNAEKEDLKGTRKKY
ncbi:Cysteine--tRNA ligase, cytoplasmic [Porphyridium purpureum]|uniref:cysteine--tRNA ligase n=1 Tax=Porphyridium purpureum TaxID=35688 RepID=A0A5J4YNC0_PORPP|nr:Cysteine--tRNA ligase, cytoplasmic [Porphyridium purpureum]|eukprot:POR9578..scf249_10